MFDIKYRINQDVLDEISKLTSEEFDNDFTDIEGQIELSFGDNKYGICDERYPFSSEWLLNWFALLNDIITNLRIYNYIAIRIPETYDSYFVFRKVNDILLISLERSRAVGICGFLTKEPLNEVYEYSWKNESVSIQDFENKIVKITKQFIKNINLVNQKLLSSNAFKKFILNCKFNIQC